MLQLTRKFENIDGTDISIHCVLIQILDEIGVDITAQV